MFDKPKIWTSTDMMKVANDCGSHYFQDKTMKAWGSRLLEGFWPTTQDRTEGMCVVSNYDRFRDRREYAVVWMFYEDTEPGEHLKVDVTTYDTDSSDARTAKKKAKKYADVMLYTEDVDHG